MIAGWERVLVLGAGGATGYAAVELGRKIFPTLPLCHSNFFEQFKTVQFVTTDVCKEHGVILSCERTGNTVAIRLLVM